VQWFLVSYDPVTDTPTGSLGSGTFVGPTPGVYNTVSFAPVAIAAGAEVVAEIWTSDRYVATGTFFTVDYVNGNLTGPADSAVGVPTHRNGRFRSGAVPAFPSQGNNSSYFVDIVFEADAVAVTGVLTGTLPHVTGELDGETSAEGVLAATLPALTGDIVGLVTQHGVLDATLPALRGAFRGSSAAGGATVGPCGWSIPDPLCCTAAWAATPADVKSAAADYAATILWAATGRQFGLCEVTVRPCGMRQCNDGGEFWGYDWSGGTWVPYIFNGQWFNCMCPGVCCCEPRCQMRLMGPVFSIVEVLIGGVAVDPATYRVDDNHWLVRTAGECWPWCADLDTDDGANVLEVTYLRGDAVPNALLRAASALECEWAKACVGDDTCRLSNRVTSLVRSGITIDMVSPEELLESGLTGLWEVDTVIRAFNPYRLQERLRVYAPELNVPRQTTWP
jgi:hypothetical protein